MNKIIVAGSRGITDPQIVRNAINESGFQIDELVCGLAQGVDLISYNLYKNKIPITGFPANWRDLNEQPQYIKIGKNGQKYNSLAGHNRNQRMAEYATHLIAIRLNNSSGTTNMIKIAQKLGLTIFVKDIPDFDDSAYV